MKKNYTKKEYEKKLWKYFFRVMFYIYTAYCIMGFVFSWTFKWGAVITVLVVTLAVTLALFTIIYIAVLSALLVWNGDLCDEGGARESGQEKSCEDKDEADDRT